MHVRVPLRFNDTAQPLLSDTQEYVWGPSGPTSVHGNTNGSIRGIFESSRHRETTGEFSMNLAFRCPGTDGTPTDQIRGKLGGNGIEELASGGKSQLGDVGKEGSCDSESFVDLEGAVHVWVVDETFPADRRTGFLEVDTHDDVQVVFGLLSVFLQPVCVFEGGFDIMHRAWPNEHINKYRNDPNSGQS